MLNTIVAESLDYIATQPGEAAIKGGKDLNKAIQDLLPGILKESKKVIFNGDNYSEEWHKEAEKRGLPNLQQHRRCPAGHHPQGLDRAVRASTRSTASANCRAATPSCCENYVKTVNIEAG